MTKKLRYLCTLLLMAVASGVWADTSTVTASKITDTSVSWNGSAGEAWSVSVTGGATGQNLNNGYAQVGTSKNPSKSITLSTSGIKGTITSIVVDCAGTGTISTTVGGSAFGTQSQSIPTWSNNSGGEVTFSNANGATGEIVITMTNSANKAMYIKSITVTWSSSITATVAAPTFDPAGGTYTATQNVTISCATAGADIYYTLDGNTPTTASTKYTGPISISETKTLKAFAVKEGMNSSAVTTAEYTINKTTDDLVTDVMTAAKLAATSNTYTDFSNVSLTSNAVYAGQSAKADGGYIQLRSKNSNSGIVTTASGGTISSITIDVADATNTIDVYGRNTAYTSAGDLYGESPGALLGSILSTGTIEVTGSYAYVGVRSRSGAVYISSIEFKWIPASDTPTAATPSFSLGSGTYTGTQTVSISCETEGASIYYTLDGSDPTTSSTLYSEPIAISADATLKAIAVASGMENSVVATADYIIIDPNTSGASEATAYTVAEAIEFINGLTGTSAYNVYVKGTISRVQSYSDGYKSITYWISDDGTTSSEMQVYNGKGVDKADFSNIDDLQTGDEVMVCGKVKLFSQGDNTIYEFDSGNYLVSLTSSHKQSAGLAFDKNSLSVELNVEFTEPTLTNPHSLTVTYSSTDENVATVGTDGTLTIIGAGHTTIKASFAGNDEYEEGEASYTLTVADPDAKGGRLNPYTVAEAITFIGTLEGKTSDEVYVKGIISQIDEVSTEHGNATYWISDDGTTTKQLEVYRGKYLEKAQFTSEDQIALGNIVTVCGKVKLFTNSDVSTPEFTQNNCIYELTIPSGETISTGINNVEQTIGDAAIYNLNGVRVNKVQKGVYVVNGKKVVIK